MSNGNRRWVRAFALAFFTASIAGCDLGAAPPPGAHDPRELELPSARYQIDPARNRVWFLTQAGVFVYDVSRPERVALSLPGWITLNPIYGCLPDLALGPRGEAVITSNILPTLWRVDPDTLAVSVHPLELDADTDKDVGFSGIAYSQQHKAFLAVSYIHGTLWNIDPLYRTARKIPLSAPIPRACGVAVPSRNPQPASRRAADVCVRTAHGDRSVAFAAGGSPGYVWFQPCTDRP